MATFHEDDDEDNPKEQFYYHSAGLDGFGGSSALDAVILRDRDANTAWSAQSDGTLEERVYYCQNWRNDVVALVTDGGEQIEQVRYSAYGVPFGLPAGDLDSDGEVNSDDLEIFDNLTSYDVRADLDLDGDYDSTDESILEANEGHELGWGALSLNEIGSRKGYAGYEFDSALAANASIYHVRARVLHSDLGRWTSRDPLGYVDGGNLYEYVRSNPLAYVDPFGTDSSDDGGGANQATSGGQGKRGLTGAVKYACGPGNPYCMLCAGPAGFRRDLDPIALARSLGIRPQADPVQEYLRERGLAALRATRNLHELEEAFWRHAKTVTKTVAWGIGFGGLGIPTARGVGGAILRRIGFKRLRDGGWTFSRGPGYGSKPRFEYHRLPDKPSIWEPVRGKWFPHYHRRGGKGGIGKHRPVECRSGDRFRDRF